MEGRIKHGPQKGSSSDRMYECLCYLQIVNAYTSCRSVQLTAHSELVPCLHGDTRIYARHARHWQVLSWRQKPLEELPDSLQQLIAMRAPHSAECKLCQHVVQHRVAIEEKRATIKRPSLDVPGS